MDVATSCIPFSFSSCDAMNFRPLGRTGLAVSPLGFGAFKIGRNQNVKYPSGYELPDDAAVDRLLSGVLDAGINLIDTAPAYGLSEERIGRAISHRREEFVLCTKVGETFTVDADGRPVSTYDFSEATVRASVERSLKRLRTDAIDVLLLHSDGRDLFILQQTDAVEALLRLKQEGLVRFIGLSGKTAAGHHAALDWADVIMAEYHAGNRGEEVVIAEAAAAGIGVLVKKGLAAGHLEPGPAIRFVLSNPDVSSLVVGGLNLDHIRENVEIARSAVPAAA
jgi:aryl-alcohol dehydrogenase-like predicted oxidoreductase